ncbi:MAG: DUF937 domain-containing protein [Clostridia bacterium]|jgi:hypothetical protein|nr:DUF937 domain-containing protein [Clostridia bacterium]MBR5365539.1 DUF937 domain-containing protein [Clostridia bacterium]
MSLLSTLIGSMSTDESAEAISRKTGVSKSLTSSLVAAALPLLFKKLTSNASSQQGAASLLGALAQHTDTASVASQIANADTADGNAIIGHILGSDQAATVSQLAAQTNLSEEQVSSVLGNIAPALMSSLSAANTENVQAQAAAAVQSLEEEKPASGGGLGSLLGGILGGGSSSSASSSSSGAGSLLSALFGGKKEEKEEKEEAAIDGSSLLNLLLNMK